MNKFPRKSILFIVVIILVLLGILAKISHQLDNNEVLDIQIGVSPEAGNVTKDDIEAVKGELKNAIQFIPQLLGVKQRKKVKIKIVAEGICITQKGNIFIPILHIRNKSAAIIHELIHIIARHENNSFYSEGLAVYFQEKYGNFKSFPNFSLPLDELLRNHKEQLINLSTLKDDNEIFAQVGTEKRRLAYIEAGSFIHYLVVKFGMQKLADLNQSSSLSYKDIYGKTFQELETDWKSFVFGETFNN